MRCKTGYSCKLEYDNVKNRIWNAAVIGLGKIGMTYDFDIKRTHPSSHVLAYNDNENVNLVTAMDVENGKKEMLKKLSPTTSFYTSVENALKNKNIDIVSICTPQQYHLKNIIEVLEYSNPKIIFCEKPLVKNTNEISLLKNIIDNKKCIIIPDISRRWLTELQKVTQYIAQGEYGSLEKISIRYTRGIFNTGTHLFDLLKMWTGNNIEKVRVLKKVSTSSEDEGEQSFSFFFEQKNGVYGYAEAIDDREYYLFDIDLFFSQGKIEMRNSGNDIYCYSVGKHSLFSGYRGFKRDKHISGILSDSSMKKAVDNIIDVLEKRAFPVCTMRDAFYPIYVAETLLKSYKTGKEERVDYYE